jgi:molecular chaperone DnaK
MSTIQIWIDLWTTNSAIAYNNSWKIEVIKNLEQGDFTPSVFWYDKAKNALVWKKAYEKLFQYADKDDINNFKAEVKRLMWSPEITFFPRVNKNMKAEEISAEILKYLKTTVVRKFPDVNTIWVVITIPAHFSTLESEATKRAWELAWFKQVVLLQEPIAAAVAYWFWENNNNNWLVYDLWWWTFDIAIIQSQDGLLNIISSKWDNFLWWKDFDWAIVDNIFIPKILEKFNLLNFNRWNEKYKTTFNILKWLAEDTKKMLSYDNEINVEIDKVWLDDNWEEIYLSITINIKEFEKLIKPFIDKSISLTKETIDESWINKSSIDKIVLVWWSTQTPLIKEQLEKEFWIKADSSVNPLTVVAEWAAIYSTTQIIKDEFKEDNNKVSINSYNINLNYEPVTTDDEEIISWTIEGIKDNEELYIQIQSESWYYSSNKILVKNWKFIATINIEIWKPNTFWIYLFNDKWDTLELNNDNFIITHWLSVGSIPIPYNLWVAIKKQGDTLSWSNKMHWFFEKNNKLPLSDTIEFKTTDLLKKWSKDNVLPIKVFEWESDNPDRNVFIADLWLTWEEIPYDLDSWTAIEITLNIDESRQLTVSAYIPSIDLSLNARTTILDEKIEIDILKKDLENENERYLNIRHSLTPSQKEELDKEMSYIKNWINNTWYDEDEKRKANKKLKDFKIELDNLEKNGELDVLLLKFKKLVESLDEIILKFSDSDDYKIQELVVRYKTIKSAWDKAVLDRDKILLVSINEQLEWLITSILMESISWWENLYNDLKFGWYNFTDRDNADFYFKKWENAIKNDDKGWLEDCVRTLWSLLPKDDMWKVEWWNISWITL